MINYSIKTNYKKDLKLTPLSKIMPKLKVNSKEFVLKNGEAVKNYCEEAGVIFGCEDGQCGTCMIEIHKGKELLGEINDKEMDLGIEQDGDIRLACQCKINGKDSDFVECKGYI